MNAITTLVQPESASSVVQFREGQRVTPPSSSGHRPALETELSDIFGRAVTGAIAEARTAVARSRAADHVALEAVRVALEQQTHRNDSLNDSLRQRDSLIEELRMKLQVERDNTKAATDACEKAQKARAEQASAAEAGRQQLVAGYESRLRALQAELDAARAALVDAQQQYEREAAGRARAIAALKTVQQACALVESEPCGHDVRTAESRREGTSETQDDTRTSVEMRDDAALDTAASARGRSLKLVAPDDAAPVAPPPHLMEYLRELFDQIKSTYIVDLQTHAMNAVVDRLCVNVRHARDVFVQRASVDGLTGGDLFDQALSAKLHEFGATSLGRHLSIVAYELAHADGGEVRAEAS